MDQQLELSKNPVSVDKVLAIHQVVYETLQKLPDLPTRVDAMSPNEFKMYSEIVVPLIGALRFVADYSHGILKGDNSDSAA